MSSNPVEPARGSFSLRLNLWYSGIFILTACGLFLLAYFVLASAIQQRDREVLQAKLDEYRAWYEGGKLRNKRNTFTDFIACAEHLIAQKFATTEKLAIQGGSAGGLLVGACLTMRPDLFKAVIAKVPFVDVITTMSDPSIPLTTLEWDEWGDPKDREYFDYMMSYSPYDQVRTGNYPDLLITTGLNDPRVAYWEPAKFAAKIREHKTAKNLLLLKINMDAGHAGASGRYDYLKEIAFDYAFLLDRLTG